MNDPWESAGPRAADVRRIRSLAVHVDDLLTALEARERVGRPAVLRVTPPFAGRMRARLHVVGGEGRYVGEDRPIHVPPGAFVEDIPSFPSVDDTEDELRAEGEYSVERHHEAHERVVAEWRETVGGRLREHVAVKTEHGPHEVRVSYLGGGRDRGRDPTA